MIFVSVGTNEARFDRLLRAVAELPDDGGAARPARPLDRAFPAPASSSSTSSRSTRWPTRSALARSFVTHAGVGSVLVALANGKRPIVVPRRKAFGEAVDDHQLQLGRRFAAAGLVTLVEGPAELARARPPAKHDSHASRRAPARSPPTFATT